MLCPSLLRLCRRVGWLGLPAVVLVAGCATVDPRADFEKTAGVISDRTGVEEVYSPETDALVAGKVDRLLADGLSLDEAVQIALLNNRAFQSLFQEIGVARADVVQSGLLTNPSLTFGVRFPEAGGRSELTLGLAQQLVDLWQIPVRKGVAEAKLERTVLDVAYQATELAAEVRKKCYAVLALQQTERVTRENRDVLSQSFDLVQKQVNAGEATPLDANLVRVSVMEADCELLAIARDRQMAEAELSRLLGLSREVVSWQLVGSMPSPSLPSGEDAEWLVYAMKERLDAQMAGFEVIAAEQELRREYLQVFPDVTVGFNGERTERRALPGRKILADTARASVANGQLTAPSIESRAERDLARRQIIDSMLGPSLTVMLPVWDQNQAQIAKASYRAVQARRQYEDVLDAVAEQVQRALVAAREDASLVRFFEEKLLPQTKQNVEGARRICEVGEQNVLVLLDAQRSMIAQRAAYVGVLRDYAVAVAELERAVGGRLLSTSAAPPAFSDLPGSAAE